MQNTYQEKSLDPIDKDFLFGKKLEGGIKLSAVSDFKPAGDQPEAIKKLISGIKSKKNDMDLGFEIMVFCCQHLDSCRVQSSYKYV